MPRPDRHWCWEETYIVVMTLLALGVIGWLGWLILQGIKG